jgi:hypothetical protein
MQHPPQPDETAAKGQKRSKNAPGRVQTVALGAARARFMRALSGRIESSAWATPQDKRARRQEFFVCSPLPGRFRHGWLRW